ncbi:MAG: M14 family zinc carboxypeptidase [Thermoleophilaceae bacterium]
MRRLTVPGLAIAFVLGVTAPAHAAPEAPSVLPAVTKTLSGASCSTAAYTAPMSGYLDVRLRGAGDWDLELRDGAQRLAASRGFGGREVVQAWVQAGQRLTAQGCRADGAGRNAQVAFELVDVAPPAAPAGTAKLVRVSGTPAGIEALEAAGLDVTHARGEGWADVIVSGSEQLDLLKRSGLGFETRIADLNESAARAREADRRYAATVGAAGSPLPSGRTEYRTYEDVQAELKQLVEGNPGLVREVVFGTSFQGRELSGVEIGSDVDGADGRPVYFVMGVHHAREWPSVEASMELAHLLVQQQDDPRIADLLARERIVILPLVNPDGFISSRNAFDLGDTLGQDPNVTLVEAVAPFGGTFAYRRKNCNGEIGGPEVPCELAWGVDPNRNYGNLWGGNGASSDVTSQSYHGPGPRSESEVQAVWDYVRTHHVTTLISIHNVAALVLRPPGLKGAGLAPDEERMKQIGDAMGAAAGYVSQYGFQLYDTAGTTEDDSYAGTGGYGFTIEMGPPDGNFHMPYETGVVAEWTGENEHANGSGGLREALLIGAEAAASAADHAVLQGTAPAGNVLRLRKQFETLTSSYCEKGIEPVVNVGLPIVCLTGEQPPQTLQDEQDTTTTVPADGAFEWHIGQSTRPFVGGGAVIETLTDVDPPLATFNGAPGVPTETVNHEFSLPADLPADKLRIALTLTPPEDYDIEVFRKEEDGSLTPLGSSANLPGENEEVVVDAPQPGDYVVAVHYFAAATGLYEVTVTRATVSREVTTGHKEAYELTCETPDGGVLERHSLVIDRGQSVALNLGCGSGPSTFGDGTPISGDPDAPPPSTAPAVDGVPVP